MTSDFTTRHVFPQAMESATGDYAWMGFGKVLSIAGCGQV